MTDIMPTLLSPSHNPDCEAARFAAQHLLSPWKGSIPGFFLETLPAISPSTQDPILPLPDTLSLIGFADGSCLIAQKTDAGWLVSPDPLSLSPFVFVNNGLYPVNFASHSIQLSQDIITLFQDTFLDTLTSLHHDIIRAGPFHDPREELHAATRTCPVIFSPVPKSTINDLEKFLEATAIICADYNKRISYVLIKRHRPKTPWDKKTPKLQIDVRLENQDLDKKISKWLDKSIKKLISINPNTLSSPKRETLLTWHSTLDKATSQHEKMEARAIIYAQGVHSFPDVKG